MKHTLPSLSYPYNALEPYIDAKTMEIHHTKHHQTYIDNLNKALEKYPALQEKTVDKLLRDLKSVPEDIRQQVINHGGGHANHALFWQIMGPKKEHDQNLIKEIEKEFKSIDEFKKLFNQTATTHFGSGWAWLARDANNKLLIYSLPNQDSPFLKNHTPIIGLDLWEHAYYLKYQNRRADYIAAWWNVLKLI